MIESIVLEVRLINLFKTVQIQGRHVDISLKNTSHHRSNTPVLPIASFDTPWPPKICLRNTAGLQLFKWVGFSTFLGGGGGGGGDPRLFLFVAYLLFLWVGASSFGRLFVRPGECLGQFSTPLHSAPVSVGGR